MRQPQNTLETAHNGGDGNIPPVAPTTYGDDENGDGHVVLGSTVAITLAWTAARLAVPLDALFVTKQGALINAAIHAREYGRACRLLAECNHQHLRQIVPE